MDEESHLLAIAQSDYAESAIRAYSQWLSAQGDRRAESLSRLLDYEIARQRLAEVPSLAWHAAWLDKVMPQFVIAPMKGTFYAAPRPDYPPYVKVGDECSPDTSICLIEAMKCFNEIPAGYYGDVAEVFVSNTQSVVVGQRLFRIARINPTDAW